MGRYSEYVICLFNCVYEQDNDIWQGSRVILAKQKSLLSRRTTFKTKPRVTLKVNSQIPYERLSLAQTTNLTNTCENFPQHNCHYFRQRQ